MSSYGKPRRKDWLKTLIYIAAFFAVLGFTGIYLLVLYWYIWIILAVAGSVILVSWHAKATAYHCPKCDSEFEISILTDFFSPHGVDRNGGWKYLKCPNCYIWSRMDILIKTKGKSNSIPRIPREE